MAHRHARAHARTPSPSLSPPQHDESTLALRVAIVRGTVASNRLSPAPAPRAGLPAPVHPRRWTYRWNVSLIIEYIGEIIPASEITTRLEMYRDEGSCHRACKPVDELSLGGKIHELPCCAGLTDLYIMQLGADEAIDATKKGSLARLINHSCEPNCVTQKWLVNGEVRVGIFTTGPVELGSELTYNYAMDMMSSQVWTVICMWATMRTVPGPCFDAPIGSCVRAKPSRP